MREKSAGVRNDLSEQIANNLIAYMRDEAPLEEKTIGFICNWVKSDAKGKAKADYEVWDYVLKHYLPNERPILFRSCPRITNKSIQCFTGRIYVAERFSENHKGHLLICDTAEYLRFVNSADTEYERSFFPLCECIRKGYHDDNHYFSQAFYDEYIKEDEYIVRVNNNWLYDLKWNK